MNKLKLYLLIAGLCCATSAYAVSQMTGQMLLSMCQDSLKVLENNAKDVNIQTANNSGLCLGYLTGYEDMHYVTSAIAAGVPRNYDMSKSAQYYCIPQNVSIKDQVKLVVSYLNDHPAALEKSASIVLFGVFKQAYPCKI
jgi:hypothetical protein